MAKNATKLAIEVDIENLSGLNQLKSALRGVGTQAASTGNDLRGFTDKIAKHARATGNSINSLESQKRAFEALRRSVDVTSDEFKKATAEVERLDKALGKAEGRRAKGGRLSAAAKGVGAIAAGGVFGGPEGVIGGGIGLAVGGPAGAAVGAAIGAQVGQLRQALGATAEYAANLSKLRIALQGVTTSQAEYSQALSFITDTTREFAIPQDVVTRQFTKLQASVQGAGGNLEDTKTAFNGIVAAVRATGGSLADVDAALTATAQVFSKGKVSAEELRQQIGERLPGAFTLFAQSMGITPQELDKALEKGKVSLQDFQKFAEAIFERYGENAKAIAKGPDSAGDQLKVTLQELNEEIGRILKPLGAEFQRVFNGIAKSILGAVQALDRFFGISGEQRKNALTIQVNATNLAIRKARENIKGFKQEIEESGDVGGIRSGLVSSEERLIKELEARRDRIRNELNELTRGQAVTVQQPTAGDGLPGIDPASKGGTSKVDRSAEQRARRIAQAEEILRKLRDQLNITKAQGQISNLLAKQEKERNDVAAKYNKLLEKGNDIEVQRAKIAAASVLDQKQALETQELIEAIYQKSIGGITKIVDELDKKMRNEKQYYRLLAEGVSPELAKQYIQIDEQMKIAKEMLDVEIDILKAKIAQGEADGKNTDNAKEALEDLIKRRDGLPSEGKRAKEKAEEASKGPTFREGLTERVAQLKEELKEMTNLANVVANAATAIGTAFTNSFAAVLTGTATVKEALADFFKKIGEYFVKMAMEIIAKQLVMIALQTLLKALGAVGGGGGEAAPKTLPDGVSQGGPLKGFNINGVDQGLNFGVAADGGFVRPNSTFVVGEKGPELLRMGSNGGYVTSNSSSRAAMGRYNAGNTFDSTPTFRLETTVINGVEYATVDQVRQMGAASAKRGAQMGQSNTMKSLQNSRSQRSRIGMR